MCSIEIREPSRFVRGWVYRVVMDAMVWLLVKLWVLVLMFDGVRPGPISAVLAGTGIMGLFVDLVSACLLM